MTKTDFNEMLVSYKQLSAKVEIWKECLILYDNLEIKLECQKAALQLKIINQCLNLLKEPHKFILETHLINQCIWSETIELFEQKWGVLNGRSERTLKRMQSEAIQEMLNFIETSKLENYLS